jgi:hypothetical protein
MEWTAEQLNESLLGCANKETLSSEFSMLTPIESQLEITPINHDGALVQIFLRF